VGGFAISGRDRLSKADEFQSGPPQEFSTGCLNGLSPVLHARRTWAKAANLLTGCTTHVAVMNSCRFALLFRCRAFVNVNLTGVIDLHGRCNSLRVG